MVDWSLARQIARFAAGGAQVPDLGVDLAKMSADAERQVADYTSLTLPGAPPPPEMIDRATWAEINLDTLSGFLDPVGERLSDRLGSAGPLAGALRAAASATLAAEVGLVAGYMSQRVLGQYELSLLQPEQPARLLFVGPNLVKAIGEMELDRDSFLAWIVFHEVTHVFQLAGRGLAAPLPRGPPARVPRPPLRCRSRRARQAACPRFPARRRSPTPIARAASRRSCRPGSSAGSCAASRR